MKHNKAIFPGSFDPITLGHIDLIESSLELFEQIIIGVGINKEKKYMFNIKDRKHFIELLFKNEKRITVKEYEGLTTDFCKQEKVTHIIRGIRNSIDLEYEKVIALTNYQLNKKIHTIFLLAKNKHNFISSSVVRDVILHKGNLKPFLPKKVIHEILKNNPTLFN